MPGAAMVTVQLGQCGNQLGHELFGALAREGGGVADEALPQFFRRGAAEGGAEGGGGSAAPVARSVLVDMEPKVIWQVVERASRSGGRWRYQPGGSYARAGGAGNNWAYGYGVHGPAAAESVVELVRREAEHCDRLGGLLLLQSLAGGTGSGVGTFLTEVLRDEYPTATLVNHTVWPYESGEVIVQHYNALLTLAKVAQVSDATLYAENEALDQLCGRMLNLPKPTFDHLNQVIAGQLLQLCLPATLHAQPLPSDAAGGGAVAAAGAATRPLELMVDVVRQCCPNPRYRLLSMRTLPQLPAAALQWEGTERWKPLLGNLRQMLLADTLVEARANWRGSMLLQSGARSPRSPAGASPGEGSGAGAAINRSCGAVVFVRGNLAPDTAEGSGSPIKLPSGAVSGTVGPSAEQEAFAAFGQPGVFTDWAAGGGEALAVGSSAHKVGGHQRSVGVLANSQSVVRPLERLVASAAGMLGAGAYLHHYDRHGVGREVFDEALATAEQMLHDYRQL